MADITQGTPEWHALRCGKVTASRVADLMAKTKSGWGKGRETYMYELLAERLTGVQEEGFSSFAMRRGKELEPEARDMYALLRDVDIDLVPFVDHDEIPMYGCSPDGQIGDEGLIEIKCFDAKNHITVMETGEIDKKHVTQMQAQMDCTGRKWCDFISYDPRFPPDLRMHVERVPRDNGFIGDMRSAIKEFIAEIDKRVLRLCGDKEAA